LIIYRASEKFAFHSTISASPKNKEDQKAFLWQFVQFGLRGSGHPSIPGIDRQQRDRLFEIGARLVVGSTPAAPTKNETFAGLVSRCVDVTVESAILESVQKDGLK
jgi:hypothetical protein